jgi:hypothetical protein
MAMFGSTSVTITYDDGPGGTGRAITDYVTEIGGISIEALQADTSAFGDVWGESTPTGFKTVDEVSIKGFYNDAATTGPHVVFKDVDDSPSDSTRTLVVVFGGTNGTFTIETRLKKYMVGAKVKGLTEFEAVVVPTGSGAWS